MIISESKFGQDKGMIIARRRVGAEFHRYEVHLSADEVLGTLIYLFITLDDPSTLIDPSDPEYDEFQGALASHIEMLIYFDEKR